MLWFLSQRRDSVRWERSNGPETKRPNVGGRKRERSIERGTVQKPLGKRVPVWENLCACMYAERECVKLTCKHMPSPLSPSCHQQKHLLFYHQPLNIKNTRACVRVPEWVCKSSTKNKMWFSQAQDQVNANAVQKRLQCPYFSFIFPSYFFLFSFRVIIEVKAGIYMYIWEAVLYPHRPGTCTDMSFCHCHCALLCIAMWHDCQRADWFCHWRLCAK